MEQMLAVRQTAQMLNVGRTLRIYLEQFRMEDFRK